MIGIIALEIKEGQILVRTQHLDADAAATLVSLAIRTLEEIAAKSGKDTILKATHDGEEEFEFPRGIFIGYDDEAQSLMVDVHKMTIAEAFDVLHDLNGTASTDEEKSTDEVLDEVLEEVDGNPSEPSSQDGRSSDI